MSTLAELVLGLGLFFLGMQLVGEYLRRLSGSSFRTVIRRTTHSRVLAAFGGLVFGALMQSATAVTFILVSMERSGLVKALSALPVLLWCNVGLTALAFLLSFDIHPIVAWVVGLSGIAFGMIRRPAWRAWAGILLGVGLLLFGLQSMSAGAAPLQSEQWFRQALATAEGAPWLAFLGGLFAAALLQSNTGATLLIITLATAGGMDERVAIPMIYGTNLGAVFLRIFLSLGLQGNGLRLVRFEDFFVMVGGIFMLVLFYLESFGVPLVGELSASLSPEVATRLALVFLFSNLFPVLLLWPFAPQIWRLLERWIGEPAEAAAGMPKFLDEASLQDPSTALDLSRRELGRLFSLIRFSAKPAIGPDGEEVPPDGFEALAEAIEHFGVKIAARQTMPETEARFLHLLRSALAMIRHLEESVREAGADFLSDGHSGEVRELVEHIDVLLQEGAALLDHLDSDAVTKFQASAKQCSEMSKTIRSRLLEAPGGSHRMGDLNLLDDLEVTGWLLHRFAKVLHRMAELEH